MRVPLLVRVKEGRVNISTNDANRHQPGTFSTATTAQTPAPSRASNVARFSQTVTSQSGMLVVAMTARTTDGREKIKWRRSPGVQAAFLEAREEGRGENGDRVMIGIKSAGLEMKQVHLLALEVMGRRRLNYPRQ
jgi:hypothetical protein